MAINKYLDESGHLHNIGDIDNVKFLLEYAGRFELLTGKSGAYKIGGKEFKTLEELTQALTEDTRFRWDVFKLVETAYAEYVPSAVTLKKKKDEAEPEEGKAATA